MSSRLHVLVMAILVAVLATSARAAEDKWCMFFEADNGSGMYFGPKLLCGVQPLASDGFGDEDRPAGYGADLSVGTRWAVSRLPGSSGTLTCDIRPSGSPAEYSNGVRAWSLYVAGLPLCNDDPIRIRIHRSSVDDLRPPNTVAGVPVGYRVVMQNNKGVPDAPANGTVWDLTVSSEINIGYVYLPLLKLSAADDDAMIAEGYQLSFEQYVVPEPTSMSALGAGILSLIGLTVYRRRR